MHRSYEVKDSGARDEFDSGMVRDVEDGKTDYTLTLDGPMFQRWAEHMTKGAKKYAAGNWLKARGMAEYLRFKRSALRHFLQWFWGQRDEDHAAAVYFNINGAEYVHDLMAQEVEGPTDMEVAWGWPEYKHPEDAPLYDPNRRHYDPSRPQLYDQDEDLTGLRSYTAYEAMQLAGRDDV